MNIERPTSNAERRRNRFQVRGSKFNDSGAAKPRCVPWLFSFICGFCVEAAVAAGSNAANTPLTAQIRGKVTDTAGKPLAGVVVRLEQDGWEITPRGLCQPPAGSADVGIRAPVLPDGQPTPDLEGAPLQLGLMGEYFLSETYITDFPRADSLRWPTVRRADRSLNFDDAPFAGLSELEGSFYVRWTGLLRIAEAGRYTFYLESDDGSRLFLDGKEVVSNPGQHDMREKSGEAELIAGDHPLAIEFFQGDGRVGCKFRWAPLDRAKEFVPAEVLFHRHGSWPPAPLTPEPKQIATTLTDQNGAFHFHRLAPGRYQVRCHVLGGFTHHLETIVIAENPKSVVLRFPPFKRALGARSPNVRACLRPRVVYDL